MYEQILISKCSFTFMELKTWSDVTVFIFTQNSTCVWYLCLVYSPCTCETYSTVCIEQNQIDKRKTNTLVNWCMYIFFIVQNLIILCDCVHHGMLWFPLVKFQIITLLFVKQTNMKQMYNKSNNNNNYVYRWIWS